MISNKYGFILIHPPKTGGTSIISALHRDTDEEFIIHPEKTGDCIGTVYPSSEDFPWWATWLEAQQFRESYAYQTRPRDQGGIDLTLVGAESIFTRNAPHDISDMGGGNLKHLSLALWTRILGDPRLGHYNSFTKYKVITTCRHPYTREFSVFLYLHSGALQRYISTTTMTDSKISDTIKYYWIRWVHNHLNYNQSHDGRPLASQSSYFMLPPNENNQLQHQTAALPHIKEGNVGLIRLEHIHKDYKKTCKKLGISTTHKKMPHTINLRNEWKKHLPDNILEWYTPDIFEIVHRVRAEDFDNLPYNKGSLE